MAGREKITNKDVRISFHSSKQNKYVVMIRFYDGVAELIGKYVTLEEQGDRLYFVGHEKKVQDSLRITDSGLVTASKLTTTSWLKEWEGEYKQLQYDFAEKLYFIDFKDAEPITRLYGNFKAPKLNYKKHTNEMSVEAIEAKKQIEEDIAKAEVKVTPTENLIKALFEFQVYVEGMDSAMRLLDGLNKKYK